MRENLAKAICLTAIMLVTVLSLVFAIRHNPDPKDGVNPQQKHAPSPEIPDPAASHADVAPGRAIFERENCLTCHSVAGQGNPRHPLDGVGSKLDGSGLAAWLAGAGPARTELSSAILRRKQRYQTLPAEEMSSLVDYLSSLKSSGAPEGSRQPSNAKD